ncbi:MAG: hypothetical protein UX43_C0006G0019 [Candidatus Giovannonibacteria bacterium GW2011_GWB1_46_20]|nr:MAG: hypothetical protein UW15_C0002G0026 [Parcubacteria group bacterium GW2011_GWC1_44_10]KKT59941.1 MAG: hypothetical protein UW53_C0005G0024 [Candidatus Giovannonibacteria bacterium GW2011_GWA1_44_25]KKU29744.1 MAG: hypothetical protein UX43_C0006G0019 [Candidatus Giovannonibacteria bacterium GW2011_GWB1_46_20]
MEKWCGKHVPDLTGCCAVHYTGLRELHDHELKATFFIGAVFYCPEIGCDFFDLDVDDDVVVKDVFGLNKFGLNKAYGRAILDNVVRIKILFHKLGQREGDGK